MLVATIELSEAKSNYTSKRKAINSYKNRLEDQGDHDKRSCLQVDGENDKLVSSKLSVETEQPMKKRRVIIS